MNWTHCFAGRTAQMRRSTVRELLKLTSQPGMISFAGGLPAPELFPVAEVREATSRVLDREGGRALQYSETEGVAELRDWIAARFSRPHFQVRRENVMIVSGSQQALDLTGKVFLDPGDTVLVENPTYLAMLSAWRPLGATFRTVPSDGEGMRVDLLDPPRIEGVKLAYVVPNFQNPQGTTLSLDRRLKFMALAQQLQIIVVEDNPYGELRYSGDPLPHLLELDARADSPSPPSGERAGVRGHAAPEFANCSEADPFLRCSTPAPPHPHHPNPLPQWGRGETPSPPPGERAGVRGNPAPEPAPLQTQVVYQGTFSKVLAPGLRVGWVIAHAAVIDKLVQAKQATDLHTSTLAQLVVWELVRDGLLERQIPRLREAYHLRRDAMLAALEAYFPAGVRWTRPDGGMFLLVTLPEHLEAAALLQRALQENVAFVPGDDFHAQGEGRHTLRLNFSNARPELIDEGIRRLGRVLREAEQVSRRALPE